MSSFTSEPFLQKASGKTWIVRRRFTYHVGSRYSSDKVMVPYGFQTDLASIPRLLWNILPPFSTYYLKAAICHDYLYQSKQRTRREADYIFLEAMEVLGANWLLRHILFWAVRVFGFIGYSKNNLPVEVPHG